MNPFHHLFGKKPKNQDTGIPEQTQKTQRNVEISTLANKEEVPTSELQIEPEAKGSDLPLSGKRSIRVFVSSTFRDMTEERDAMMTHTWPELRKFCAERHVELVEVDLRWGIAEEQSTRKETLKLCLDEIRACRPFFIGLLGERYGWVPGDDAFTADLMEEQPWLKSLDGKSVTELEILHGVLNNPEMAGRAFFYFREPEYAKLRGTDFISENEEAAKKQSALKTIIRKTCQTKNISLTESYSSPQELAPLVLSQLKAAIEHQFPIEDIPDPLDREASDHEAFAEIRRRTYIGRPDYFQALDNHCLGDGAPLVLLGDSGSGKSALFANWVDRWRKLHPSDFIFQHYIGGSSDSSSHWKLMTRLIKEIKRWTDDPEELPKNKDDLLKDFPVWLVKSRIKAERVGVRFIVILDALNQLDDHDHGRILGWLPEHPFTGALRLMVSTLPGETLDVLHKREWTTKIVEQLTPDERSRMIIDYLSRFGKKLDKPRLDRLSSTPAAANPLYLKILLDELRVTGTHDKLDERLDDYLSANDIPSLLQKVLARYQRDYENERKGLVSEALGLIWAARRGLTEIELLQLLRPNDLPQLPLAIWTPLRFALEDSLIERGGILNFAHDFLRNAVEAAFLSDLDKKDDFRTQLADYFEVSPPSTRSYDELPWLLFKSEMFERLRNCLLNIDFFLEICIRDENELRGYWVNLNEERNIGKSYLESFKVWSVLKETNYEMISRAANWLGYFLTHTALYTEAEQIYRLSMQIAENCLGKDHLIVAIRLDNLAFLLKDTSRMNEAEPLMRRALQIFENNDEKDDHNLCICLNNLSLLLAETNRICEAELLLKRAIQIDEKNYGKDNPKVTDSLNNYAALLLKTNKLDEAESLMMRVLQIDEANKGKDHPDVAIDLNNLAMLLTDTKRINEAEPLMRRALQIDENCYGKDHPSVARDLNNLALHLQNTKRINEAETLMRRALQIDENIFGENHPKVARDLSNLGLLLKETNSMGEAESLLRRATEIFVNSLEENHPDVGSSFSNLAILLQDANRMNEAEPMYIKSIQIRLTSFGIDHPLVATNLNNLVTLLSGINRLDEAEPILGKAITIIIDSLGIDHPDVNKICDYYMAILQLMGWSFEKSFIHIVKLQIPVFKKMAVSVPEKLQTYESQSNPTFVNNDLGKLVERKKVLIMVLESAEKTYNPGHSYIVQCQTDLASIYKELGELNKAKDLLLKALKSTKVTFESEHLSIALCQAKLAFVHKELGELNEAKEMFRQALVTLENSYEPTHPSITLLQSSLAEVEMNLGNFNEAELLFRKVLEIREKSLPIGHPDTNDSYTFLADLLEKTGRQKEAKELLLISLECEPNEITPLDLRARATKYYQLEEYEKAKKILNRLLEKGFEPASTHQHLARICLITDRFDEAKENVATGWQQITEAKAYIVARLIWFKIVLGILENYPIDSFIGQIKGVLQNDEAFMEWTMEPVLDHLKPKVTVEQHALLSALVDAMSFKENLKKLDDFQEWIEAKPEKIE